MKKLITSRGLALFVFALAAASARAQDVAVVAKSHYKVLVDNAFVRVVENTLKPGEMDPMHTHPAGWFYVTQPGTMKVVHQDGRVEMWEAKAGKRGWSDAEGPHTSENVGKTTMGFVLVEVKSAASVPAKR